MNGKNETVKTTYSFSLCPVWYKNSAFEIIRILVQFYKPIYIFDCVTINDHEWPRKCLAVSLKAPLFIAKTPASQNTAAEYSQTFGRFFRNSLSVMFFASRQWLKGFKLQPLDLICQMTWTWIDKLSFRLSVFTRITESTLTFASSPNIHHRNSQVFVPIRESLARLRTFNPLKLHP